MNQSDLFFDELMPLDWPEVQVLFPNAKKFLRKDLSKDDRMSMCEISYGVHSDELYVLTSFRYGKGRLVFRLFKWSALAGSWIDQSRTLTPNGNLIA
jgi:hypothetical protein